MAQTQLSLREFLERVADRARGSRSFAAVEVSPVRVECLARGPSEPALYRVDTDAGRVWVSLVMKDRWLSQSIEADLVHTGDSIGELIEEEWVDLGGAPGTVACEHFRSEDKLFTYRTSITSVESMDDAAVERGARMLLAYEACFRRLGDMNAEGEPD